MDVVVAATGDRRVFFRQAAEHMWRELVDLARHYYGPEAEDVNHNGVAPRPDDSHPGLDPPDANPNDLELWTQFHEEVERLPVRECEVVDLVFYHGRIWMRYS